jgi:hypothetical protein
MARLLVHVEGETEEVFVNEILRPHLYSYGYTNVSARIVGNSRIRDRRGGIKPWSSVRKDILKHLKEDQNCLATTMVDYYALPQQNSKAWPGREKSNTLPFKKKALEVQRSMMKDVAKGMGQHFNSDRFIPFVVMHEFEGLLFSDCDAFSRAIYRPDLKVEFQNIRDQFDSPEEINDSPVYAPSKRVERLVRGYQKPLFGPLAIEEIGLEVIRSQCPHFDDWLTKLESLN